MEITITMKIENEELKDLFGLQNEESKTKVKVRRKEKNDRSVCWSKSPELNKYFLLQQQNYANEKLKHRGYLFLNEVYDMLGLPNVGWVYDERHPIGDNYVDFGLFNNSNFVNGLENSVLLKFNVDRNIFDRMEKES
jgi:hypothetical protein